MEFKKVKLGEIIKVQIDNRGRNPEKYINYSKFPVIDNYLIKNEKYPNIKNVNRYIDEDTKNNFLRGHLEKDDVIITLVGNGIGNVTMVPSSKCVIIQNTLGLRCNELMTNDFLYYTLISNRNKIVKYNRGSSQPSIRKTDLFSYEINVPTINYQKKITKILNSLDSKIEINNKIISNLESQAQAIFKSWFVDFEPFQDGDFVESELGMIPEGWEVKELGEIINLYDNKRVPISKMDRDKMEKNYPYYGANGIIDYVDNYLFDGKYLLMGEDGTVRTEEGFPILNYVDEKFWVSNHAHIMRGTLVSTEYIYLLLSKMFINNIVTGAVQEKINQRNLKGIKIIFPEKKELESFEKIIEPMFKMKLYLNNQNTKLAELRDALLPKLMAGEIDVSNIKIEGEEVKNE